MDGKTKVVVAPSDDQTQKQEWHLTRACLSNFLLPVGNQRDFLLGDKESHTLPLSLFPKAVCSLHLTVGCRDHTKTVGRASGLLMQCLQGFMPIREYDPVPRQPSSVF